MTLEREIALSQAHGPEQIAALLTKRQWRTLQAMPDRRTKSLRTAHRHAKVGFVALPFRLCAPVAPGREALTPLGLAVKRVAA